MQQGFASVVGETTGDCDGLKMFDRSVGGARQPGYAYKRWPVELNQPAMENKIPRK